MTDAKLGNYFIIEPLDKGGMGAVYVAQRIGSPDICVLKQILPELLDHPTVGKRFRREAQLTALVGFEHPNVPRLLDAGTLEDGSFYMALEFVEGVDLERLWHHLVKGGHMVPYQLTTLAAADALAGLHFLHTLKGVDGQPLNLVHRDLSGRNIMMNTQGVAKVIDFGVAHAELGDFQTSPGHVLGTPRFFAPETIFGETNQASDQYSLGVLVLELLSARAVVPWEGKMSETAKFILETPMPLLSTLNPEVTNQCPGLDEVLNRALQKEADKRYADCAAFRLALLEAIAPWANTPRDKLATFLRDYFPDPFARIAGWREQAKENFVDAGYDNESTGQRRISMPTRTGMAPGVLEIDHALSQEENTVIPVDLTKPGVVRPKPLVSEKDLETNLVERDRPNAANKTRTAMMLEVPDTRMVMPAGTLSDPAEAIGRAPRKRSSTTWVMAGLGGVAAMAVILAVATSGTRQGVEVQTEQPAEVVAEATPQIGVEPGNPEPEPEAGPVAEAKAPPPARERTENKLSPKKPKLPAQPLEPEGTKEPKAEPKPAPPSAKSTGLLGRLKKLERQIDELASEQDKAKRASQSRALRAEISQLARSSALELSSEDRNFVNGLMPTGSPDELREVVVYLKGVANR